MAGAVQALLSDGRLHLQHGPIDLIIGIVGDKAETAAARRQAWAAFDGLLDRLVAELPVLRCDVSAAHPLCHDPVAQAMVDAVLPHREVFVTPMAAVAGAVADAVLAALTDGRKLRRAYVNNGGDIALHLAVGESLSAGVVGNVDLPVLGAAARITAAMPVRGIATSGWRGRSHSFGIADAVTVLAATAAAADAAATLVANAVDVDHPAIARLPARELDPDSDLGERAVTVSVGDLPDGAIDAALLAGVDRARGLVARGLIHGALLTLRERAFTVGGLASALDNGTR